MKIIDLLNKIANGEEMPKKIIFKYSTYQFDKIDKVYRNIKGNQQLEQDYMISNKLNDEVKIIEDKKIEKLKNEDCFKDDRYGYSINIGNITNKINEIIDYINKEE